MELKGILRSIAGARPEKAVFSKPVKGARYKKISIVKSGRAYKSESFTEKQAFHASVAADCSAQFGNIAWLALMCLLSKLLSYQLHLLF